MARNLLLVVVSVLLSFGLAEVGVRAVGLRRPLRPYQRVTHTQRAGERLECFGPEITRAYYARHGHCVAYPSNNHQLRRRGPTTLLPEKGIYRVLGLGDSFLFGFGVFQEDTLFDRLERTLNGEERATGLRGSEWLNAAVPGSTATDELRLYERTGRKLSPDLVVLGINVFDVTPLPTSFIIDPGPRDEGKPLFRLWDWLVFRWEVRRSEPQKIQHIVRSYTPELQERYVAILSDFHKMLNAEGRSLLVMIYPIFHDFENYAFAPIHERLNLALEAKGIPHLDFLSQFRGEKASRFWITPFDQHPNELANERFHRATLDYLRETRLTTPFSS